MNLYQPTKYLSFITYCNKRKQFCQEYQQAKHHFFNGEIDPKEYFKRLKGIQQAAIELELRYFDILHMRLS